ncbi:MAG: Crp/Fnr family transcriptional regulator [Rhodospirillales bacterium]|nr:Crp/Fnr family transcriptional regulator [Rhodospirillales bacterium]
MALSREHIKELLSEHFLLRSMPEAELNALAGQTKTISIDAEGSVFKRGDTADEMMILISGEVQISAPSKDGDKIVFANVHPGDVFGEMALIDGHERSANATAMKDTELLSLERDAFLGTLVGNSELCLNLLKVMCRRLRHSNEHLEDFTLLDLRRRLAKRLNYLSQSGGAGAGGLKFSVRISLNELVAMMGVGNDAVQRHLELLERDGIISLDGNWITVENQDGIQAIIDEDL